MLEGMRDTYIEPTSERSRATRGWRQETMSMTSITSTKMIMTQPASRPGIRSTFGILTLLLAAVGFFAPASTAQDPAEAPATAPATAPAPARAQDADALQAERSRRELMEQKTYLLVDHYMTNARNLEERLDFGAAERELQKAQALDPSNRVVAQYLQEIQALLGRPEAEAALLRRSARERYEAQRQQKRTLALTDLSAAREAYDTGDYEMAVNLTRGVMNQIDWTEGEMEWDTIPADAEAFLARAEQAKATQDSMVRRKKREETYRRLRDEEDLEMHREEYRIQSLIIAATSSFDNGEYEEAQEMAQSVLDIDQHNTQALAIVEASRDAAREYADRLFVQRRREEFNRWRNEMERVRIPTTDIFTAPDMEHWAKITRLRGSHESLGLAGYDPERAALLQRMEDTRMDVEFDQKTITEVANNIYFSTDIPVSVDPEVVIALDDNAETVTLSGLRNLTVDSVLNIIVDQVGDDLAWTVRNGRAFITTKEKAAGAPIVRVHPIQDLTFKLTDFKGTNIREIALPGEAGDDSETTIFNSELDQVTLIDPEEVLNLVRENIASEDWDLSDSYSIDFVDNNNLLVIHTPEVQAQVATFLNDLRAFSTSMVTLESRFFSITDTFIEEIGTDLRGLDNQGEFSEFYSLDAAGVTGNPTQGLDNLGDGDQAPQAGLFYEDGNQFYAGASENFFTNPLGSLLSTVGGGAFQFTILNDLEINIVMNLVSKSENAVEISAPMVSVYNTQRAFVTVVNQVSFVQGYEVDVATAAFIADPVIGIAQEGIVLDVRPTISYDRKYVALDVQTTVAELERPFPSITTLLGPNGSPVQFSLPVLNVQDAQTTVVVPDGGAVILGGFKHVRYKNRTAESPWFADVPILGFFFREKGLSDEVTDLIIVIRAQITDFGYLRDEG
jgi:hypothetical protein